MPSINIYVYVCMLQRWNKITNHNLILPSSQIFAIVVLWLVWVSCKGFNLWRPIELTCVEDPLPIFSFKYACLPHKMIKIRTTSNMNHVVGIGWICLPGNHFDFQEQSCWLWPARSQQSFSASPCPQVFAAHYEVPHVTLP